MASTHVLYILSPELARIDLLAQFDVILASYKLRTDLIPSSTWSITDIGNEFIFSVKNDLSIVMIWDTLITLSLGSFDFFFESIMLPGAAASRRFVVITAAITVLILLSLNSLA